MECLDPFGRFLHDQSEPRPVLLKAGLAHVQFETIHPFLDGNRRNRLFLYERYVALLSEGTEPIR
jgi:Fic family protein